MSVKLKPEANFSNILEEGFWPIFLPKNYKKTVCKEKLQITFLYIKAVCKMMVKLAPM